MFAIRNHFESVAQAGSQRYLVTVTVGALRENGLGIMRSTEAGGTGHCEIAGRETRRRLNNTARSAEWVPIGRVGSELRAASRLKEPTCFSKISAAQTLSAVL